MSVTRLPTHLRRLVEEHARWTCEYCLLPADVAFFPHEVDHIIAEKHGGAQGSANLAYACWRCNRHKGTDLASFDPATGLVSSLYDPRRHRWSHHFVVSEGYLVGLTPVGRTTARLLQFNTAERVTERRRLIALQRYRTVAEEK